ncbi:MAG: hypothetical protein QOG55_1407 [Acidobacteriaceae bacterium]|nr:hypothetical protein [Acidobacteriaceae bacterium]
MIILLTTSLMVTSWHDCWFQVARSVQSGDHFLPSDLSLPTWPDSCCHDFRELAFIERSHLGRNGGIFGMAKTTTYGSSEIIKEPQISHPS